jgi:biopolymer transport protein ExbD
MSKPGSKKNLDFNIDLIPVISFLSVCICFLLLTAVWVQIGSINVKQAIGGQSASDTVREPMLSFVMLPSGDLAVEARDMSKLPRVLAKTTIKGGSENIEAVKALVTKIKSYEPDLRSALIEPNLESEYEKIVGLMDELKSEGLVDLGIVPL